MATEIPIEIAGGSTFGRYPIISSEKTINMYISDNWLISYPGFRKVLDINDNFEGRGIFHSIRGNFIIYVVGNVVYKITGSPNNTNLGYEQLFTIESVSGEVYIDENLESQIVIVDGHKYYVYYYGINGESHAAYELATGEAPGYVSYINSYFIIAKTPDSLNAQQWLVYEKDPTGTDTELRQVPVGGSFIIETKPDKALAVIRMPGKGNHIMVFGTSVTELWTQVGDVQNFARNSSFNIDYGCVSPSTIAASDGRVCWLAANENSAPTIMVSDGAQAQPLSTDGINDQLQKIKYPSQSTAYFYRQDGHVFYVLTFFNNEDNLTIAYDFNTGKFSHLTDEDGNFHPARQVVYYAETTYFASLDYGSMFELSSDIPYATYDIDEQVKYNLPRIRVCNTVRVPNSGPFRVQYFGFLMEQGVNDFYVGDEDLAICSYMLTEDGDRIVDEEGNPLVLEGSTCITNNRRPAVDLSISKNGGMTFSNSSRRYLNSQGFYRNRVEWHRLGYSNEFTVQIRFYGLQRFVANNGTITIY